MLSARQFLNLGGLTSQPLITRPPSIWKLDGERPTDELNLAPCCDAAFSSYSQPVQFGCMEIQGMEHLFFRRQAIDLLHQLAIKDLDT
jgi:hypothetical protein